MNWYQKKVKKAGIKDIFNHLLPFAISAGLTAAGLMLIINKYGGNESLIKEEISKHKEENNDFLIQNSEHSTDSITEIQTDKNNNIENGDISAEEAMSFTIPFETYGGRYEPYVYQDTEKNATIGYGTNIEPEANGKYKIESLGLSYDDIYNGKQKINKNQALLLMKNDMSTAINDVKSVLPNLNNYPKEAQLILVDMMYNIGINRFSTFKNMISELQKENINWGNVAYHMKDSRWYGQVGRRSKHHFNLISRM